MPLILSLTFGDPPQTQEFPGTPKALGDFLAQYFEITGGENFIPVNFGPDTPDEDSRDFPWFKTDGSGNPIGWFSWDGSEWDQLNTNVPSGTTAQRPSGAALGDLYYDTDIDVELIYNGSAWVTAAGSPGDVKMVKAATIEIALTNNPGWIQDPDSKGRVIGGAGEGSGLTERVYGTTTGAETVTLLIAQIPEHTHTVAGVVDARWRADGNVANASGNLAAWGNSNTGSTPNSGEGGLSHDNIQPTIWYWILVKE